MRRWYRRRRGGATVELAILMVVLIPLVMYTLFLEDMLYYHLEWQEAIVAPPWDPLAIDYSKKGAGDKIPGDVQHFDRQTYCDHTAAYNTYSNPDYDCADGNTQHHQALTSHQCWLITDGQQASLTLDKSVGQQVEADYDFNEGGMVVGTAKLGVLNYFIIQKFFSFWSQREVTRTTEYTGGASTVHDNARASSSQNEWTFGQKTHDYFAVVHDPWALYHLKAVQPEEPAQDDDLVARVKLYYDNKKMNQGAPENGMSFGGKLVSEELISGTALEEKANNGDDTTKIQVGYDTPAPRQFGQHWASAWSDQRQQNTHQNRENKYFSVDKGKW